MWSSVVLSCYAVPQHKCGLGSSWACVGTSACWGGFPVDGSWSAGLLWKLFYKARAGCSLPFDLCVQEHSQSKSSFLLFLCLISGSVLWLELRVYFSWNILHALIWSWWVRLQEVHQRWAYEIGKDYSVLHIWQKKVRPLSNVLRVVHGNPALGKHITMLDLPLWSQVSV